MPVRARIAISRRKYNIRSTGIRVHTDPLVTIFGCCRQDSIYNKFRVTSIRNKGTYVHYSKEALQAIEVLSNPDSNLGLAWMSSSLLGNDTNADIELLRKEFRDTDVFVLELASKLAYEKGGIYFHHVAFDGAGSVEPLKGISKRIMTKDEVAADLEQIRNALWPKPVIVVSHICTYNSGSRQEFVLELEDICDKLGMSFINPLAILGKDSIHNAVVAEPVISHLSKHGHTLMGEAYEARILEVLSNSHRPRLIQTFPFAIDDSTFHGFGDFLHGAASVHEIGSKIGIGTGITYGDTAFSQWLWDKQYISALDRKNITRLYHEHTIGRKFLESNYVFTNKRVQIPWSDETRQWILRNCLDPKPALQEEIFERKKHLGIQNLPYQVLHLRLGDEFSVLSNAVPEALEDRISRELSFLSETTPYKTIVIGDALPTKFKSTLDEPKANNKPNHVGVLQSDKINVRDALIDFFLMKDAIEIHGFSTYAGGSGFSGTAAMVFGVPYRKVNLGEPPWV